MATVTPTPVPDLGTALPDPSDRTTYGTRGRAVWDWEVNQMVPAINQLAEDTFTNAQTAEDSALIAVGSANFKGAWASLSGALNVPATVWHNSRVWALLNNLANVTTSQPGVSADWVDIGGVKRSGDTMTGPLSVPAGASGAQVPQAQEIPGLLGITGSILFFARNTAPTGWLKANGAAVSRTSYAALFAAIGTTFGVGNGSTTFNLPDLRGEFLRGWDDGRGIDSGRGFGSAQAGEIQAHTHEKAAAYGNPAATFSDSSVWSRVGTADQTSSIRTGSTGGTETRPRNIALLACIKF